MLDVLGPPDRDRTEGKSCSRTQPGVAMIEYWLRSCSEHASLIAGALVRRWLLLIAVSLSLAVLVAHPAPAGARIMVRTKRCVVPPLAGLTVERAKRAAHRAGCHVRLAGAALVKPTIQTVGNEYPRAGARGRIVTLWVNSFCVGSAALGPPEGEPFLQPGPSKLISGIYFDGGPLVESSAPQCPRVGEPSAGTITVSDMAGAVVASQTVTSEDQFAEIPLAPGSYVVVGVSGDLNSAPIDVSVPANETVRQDVALNIP